MTGSPAAGKNKVEGFNTEEHRVRRITAKTRCYCGRPRRRMRSAKRGMVKGGFDHAKTNPRAFGAQPCGSLIFG